MSAWFVGMSGCAHLSFIRKLFHNQPNLFKSFQYVLNVKHVEFVDYIPDSDMSSSQNNFIISLDKSWYQVIP